MEITIQILIGCNGNEQIQGEQQVPIKSAVFSFPTLCTFVHRDHQDFLYLSHDIWWRNLSQGESNSLDNSNPMLICIWINFMSRSWEYATTDIACSRQAKPNPHQPYFHKSTQLWYGLHKFYESRSFRIGKKITIFIFRNEKKNRIVLKWYKMDCTATISHHS